MPSGEWGTAIIFFKPLKITDEKEDGDEERRPSSCMRTYTVFNIDQVEGEHLDHLRVGKTIINADPIDTYEEADRVIAATGADIRYGGNQAFYNRARDYIQVPLREQFRLPSITRRSCTSWRTGLARASAELEIARKNGYAMGELIAEMGTCFLASELGIPNAETLPNHASYLQSWLKAMENDTKFIFQASSQASKAADYILSFSRVEEPEEVAV